jgi:DNA processing protein
MDAMDTEKLFYNAVAVAQDGDPAALRKIRKKCEGLFKPWETACARTRKGKEKAPDPWAEWDKLERAGITLVFRDEPDFPRLLREMHDPPLAIYVRGNLPHPAQAAGAREEKIISIVGTRRATPEGKDTTKRFARDLAKAGFIIVSGLALGIDAAAHEGCLDGGGKTIAVLAGGLDTFYPSENEKLGLKILASGGAIVSEYPVGQPPYPYRFLERNRIVCGFSKGVLVVEAPRRSGSLATAAYALEQNRNLFIVPGPVTHPNFFGSHSLIRQGAELVTNVSDILEAYGVFPRDIAMVAEATATAEEKEVLRALRGIAKAASVDKIIEMTKLEPRIVNRSLSFLLLKDLIRETETGYIIEELVSEN